jgi:desumoylating isopeptidase 1
MTSSNKVEMWVYDLSGGMARLLSQSLTGTQIDGIWHTSVVVFGKEVFFGQGVFVVAPGSTSSVHGHLVKKEDMGDTMIPEDVFWYYW